LVASKIKQVEVKREKEVEIVFPTFEIKEVEIVIPTFTIKLKQVQKEEVVQKIEELNGSVGIHRQVFKLHLLSLGSTIITP
jgi:hypothetical protein